MTNWTASMIEERLEEAANTLHRLPPVKVRGYFSAWPQILHDADDRRDWQAEARRLGPASAAAISRMEETLTWFRFLETDDNRLIWLRANNVSWKMVGARIGRGRTVAWQRWVYALTKIAYLLNDDCRTTSTKSY
jgi:hypothetical protein